MARVSIGVSATSEDNIRALTMKLSVNCHLIIDKESYKPKGYLGATVSRKLLQETVAAMEYVKKPQPEANLIYKSQCDVW